MNEKSHGSLPATPCPAEINKRYPTKINAYNEVSPGSVPPLLDFGPYRADQKGSFRYMGRTLWPTKHLSLIYRIPGLPEQANWKGPNTGALGPSCFHLAACSKRHPAVKAVSDMR